MGHALTRETTYRCDVCGAEESSYQLPSGWHEGKDIPMVTLSDATLELLRVPSPVHVCGSCWQPAAVAFVRTLTEVGEAYRKEQAG